MSKVINVSKARDNLYNLIDETARDHEPILIKGRRNSAVLISEEDFRAIEETLYLLSIPGMRESIVKGLNTDVDECSDSLEW
jgi:prevent-host-death family protein